MRNNYIIQYVAFNSEGQAIKSAKIRCKNRLSEFDAQAGLEKHLEKTLNGFKRLLVVSVRVETPADWLDNIFKFYK